MANRVRKISSDEATSESSVDSLSFTSLVSIQELQKKQLPKAAKQDTEFEFRSVTLNSTMVDHQRQAQGNVSVSKDFVSPSFKDDINGRTFWSPIYVVSHLHTPEGEGHDGLDESFVMFF
ncbi:hypothetical protein MLD38_036744 [Melastoma candidum]|uniref:Uncharacterized protein n=1 Tax=Melastoma candidum TaxID=119954 RepID=A0ACB9LJY8_9MYRT|nr:hypothetical protein MLD38_036744 [Melastoma candidum]